MESPQTIVKEISPPKPVADLETPSAPANDPKPLPDTSRKSQPDTANHPLPASKEKSDVQVAGQDLVGQSIKVFWTSEQQWYRGKVSRYNSAGKHFICYEDGDKEWVDLQRENWKIAEKSGELHDPFPLFANCAPRQGPKSQRVCVWQRQRALGRDSCDNF